MGDQNITRNLTINLEVNEDHDWFHLCDGDLYRALVARLKTHAGRTSFTMWKKAQKSDDAKHTNSLAKTALTHTQQQAVDMDIQPGFLIRGQQLLASSQKSFYQNLVKLYTEKNYSPKIATKLNIAATQYATKELWGMTPTPQQLWKSIRSRDIPKNICNFLWKCLHSSYKIGPYWRNILNYEEWGTCRLCREIETMQHILIDCEPSTIQCTVWELANKTRGHMARHFLWIDPWH